MDKVLLWGCSGWIGGHVLELLQADKVDVVCAKSRIEDVLAVAKELEQAKPSHVINAAGLTGRPNVDWCEDHKEETVRVNVVGTLSLHELCAQRNIHITTFATGCLYKYDATHPIGGPGFVEEDEPNFTGSFYSKTKGMVDSVLAHYPGTLLLRLRMPVSDDLHHRSLVTKITRYERVVNIPNSMTVLHDLLPVAVRLARQGVTGKFNFTNPGAISHNEILSLYRDIIDPQFTWKNFTEEEQNAVLKAERSNNTLDVSKLLKVAPEVPEIHMAMRGVFERMRSNGKAAGSGSRGAGVGSVKKYEERLALAHAQITALASLVRKLEAKGAKLKTTDAQVGALKQRAAELRAKIASVRDLVQRERYRTLHLRRACAARGIDLSPLLASSSF